MIQRHGQACTCTNIQIWLYNESARTSCIFSNSEIRKAGSKTGADILFGFVPVTTALVTVISFL